jgi:small-conductance mechanosensitive channel
VVNQVLRGDLERDLERIRQQGNLNAQQQQAAAAQFVAQTNLRIAELNAAAAANPAQAQQFQQAISAMQAAQQQAQGQQTTQLATILQQMRETTNAISPTTVMVGVGILGALGLGAVALLRR